MSAARKRTLLKIIILGDSGYGSRGAVHDELGAAAVCASLLSLSLSLACVFLGGRAQTGGLRAGEEAAATTHAEFAAGF